MLTHLLIGFRRKLEVTMEVKLNNILAYWIHKFHNFGHPCPHDTFHYGPELRIGPHCYYLPYLVCEQCGRMIVGRNGKV